MAVMESITNLFALVSLANFSMASITFSTDFSFNFFPLR